MATDPTITEILNHLLAEEKIRPAELARRTGVPQPTIHRMVTGTCTRPHSSSVKPIAEYFNITPEQLRGEESTPGLNMYKLDQEPGWSKIPLLTWKQLATWPRPEMEYSISEHGVTAKKRPQATTYTDAAVKRTGFAIYITDNAMLPEFQEQTLLIFNPDIELANECFILIRLENGNTLFRQLIIKNEQRYYKALNPEMDNTLKSFNDNDEIIGRLVQTRKDY